MIQFQLFHLKLVLNATKRKGMLFSHKQNRCRHFSFLLNPPQAPLLSFWSLTNTSSSWKSFFQVPSFQYTKIKSRFFLRDKYCFSLNSRKQLIAATFLLLFDYGDIAHMDAATSSVQMLDAVYQEALQDVNPSLTIASFAPRHLLPSAFPHFVQSSENGHLPSPPLQPGVDYNRTSSCLA